MRRGSGSGSGGLLFADDVFLLCYIVLQHVGSAEQDGTRAGLDPVWSRTGLDWVQSGALVAVMHGSLSSFTCSLLLRPEEDFSPPLCSGSVPLLRLI